MSDAAWKLVPVEPDRRMCRDGAYEVSGVTAAGAEAIYRAMVLTAPEPPAAPSPPEPAAGGVRVKPLAWHDCKALGGGRKMVAIDLFGNEFARIDYDANRVDRAALEAEMAVKQADYTARITAALEPAPSVADMAAEIARLRRDVAQLEEFIGRREDDVLTIARRAEAAEAKLAAVEVERDKAREDALREAANLVRGEVYREKNRTWFYMLPQANGCRGNRGEDDFVTQHCDTLAAAILALTTPAGGERNEGDT